MGKLGLLDLPLELREAIFKHVLYTVNAEDLPKDYEPVDGPTGTALEEDWTPHKKYIFDLSLFRTSKQVAFEARAVFRRENIFVSIETPWHEASRHVATDGHVPILMSGDFAEKFKDSHLKVLIDTPQYSSLQQGHRNRSFVILLDDLPLFTEMWYYSDLTHPGLNAHLRLTLHLHDPEELDFEKRALPKSLQKRLLEPFGRLKGLYELCVEGEHYRTLVDDLRVAMAVPYPTVETCLEESTRLKDEGNAELKNAHYDAALELYRRAFLSLMIVCDGRRRSIWGDAYFQGWCKGGLFDNQSAQLARLVLRIRLVSNTIMVYLKLQDFEEAIFWGMRSINLMPDTMDPETTISEFPAAPEIGKIYYRTGIACRELGRKEDARELLRVAVKYLPRDAIVKKDLESLTPRLG